MDKSEKENSGEGGGNGSRKEAVRKPLGYEAYPCLLEPERSYRRGRINN
jgi:hypothetical protein